MVFSLASFSVVLGVLFVAGNSNLLAANAQTSQPVELNVLSINSTINEFENLSFTFQAANMTDQTLSDLDLVVEGNFTENFLFLDQYNRCLDSPENCPMTQQFWIQSISALNQDQSMSISHTIPNSTLGMDIPENGWGPKALKISVVSDNGEKVLATKVIFVVYVPTWASSEIRPLQLAPVVRIHNFAFSDISPLMSVMPVSNLVVDQSLVNENLIEPYRPWAASPNDIDLLSLSHYNVSISDLGYSLSRQKKVYFVPDNQLNRANLDRLRSLDYQVVWGDEFNLTKDFSEQMASLKTPEVSNKINVVEQAQKFLGRTAILSKSEIESAEEYRAVLDLRYNDNIQQSLDWLTRVGQPSWIKFISLAEYVVAQNYQNTNSFLVSNPKVNFSEAVANDAVNLYQKYHVFMEAIHQKNSAIEESLGSNLSYGLTSAERESNFQKLQSQINDYLGQISIVTNEKMNITSQDVSVAITVESYLQVPVELKVKVEPEFYGINGGTSNVITIEPEAQKVIEIPIQAIANGRNHLRVTLLSENNLEIGRSVDIETWTIVEIGTVIYWIFIVFVVVVSALGFFRTIKQQRFRTTRVRKFDDLV
jgi:hypothetical protein